MHAEFHNGGFYNFHLCGVHKFLVEVSGACVRDITQRTQDLKSKISQGWHWRLQLWGTGAHAPLDLQLLNSSGHFRAAQTVTFYSVWLPTQWEDTGLGQFCEFLLHEFHNIFVCHTKIIFLLVSCPSSYQILATSLEVKLELQVQPQAVFDFSQMEVGFFTAIRRQFPRMCWCLVYLGIGRQACLICAEEEDWSFVRCPTKGCKGVYCVECWRDVHVCIAVIYLTVTLVLDCCTCTCCTFLPVSSNMDVLIWSPLQILYTLSMFMLS